MNGMLSISYLRSYNRMKNNQHTKKILVIPIVRAAAISRIIPPKKAIPAIQISLYKIIMTDTIINKSGRVVRVDSRHKDIKIIGKSNNITINDR